MRQKWIHSIKKNIDLKNVLFQSMIKVICKWVCSRVEEILLLFNILFSFSSAVITKRVAEEVRENNDANENE